MSEVRSLLVGSVAKRYAADRWPNLEWDHLNKWAQGVALRDAEVAVAAVLDAMSGGPLHEQMVEAPPLLSVCTCNGEEHAIGCPVVSSHSETIWRQTVERVLSAALGAARMEGDES